MSAVFLALTISTMSPFVDSPCNHADALRVAADGAAADAAEAALAVVAEDARRISVDDACFDDVELVLRDGATRHHRLAQKFKKADDYKAAAAHYEAYRQLPNRGPAHTRLDFFYAELLYDLGRWSDADAAYAVVVAADPAGEYARNSAYNRVLAVENIVNGKPPTAFKGGVLDYFDIDPAHPHERPRVAVPSDAEDRLVDVCDRFMLVFAPQVGSDRRLDEELRTVAFKAAYSRSARGFDDGADRLRRVTLLAPSDWTGRKAAELLLEFLLKHDRPAELASELQRMSADQQLNEDSEFRKFLIDFRARVSGETPKTSPR